MGVFDTVQPKIEKQLKYFAQSDLHIKNQSMGNMQCSGGEIREKDE